MPRRSPSATFGRDAAAEIASQLQKRTRPKAAVGPSSQFRDCGRQNSHSRNLQQLGNFSVRSPHGRAVLPFGRKRILFRPGISHLHRIKSKHASDVSAIVQPNRLKSQRSFEAGRLELSLGTAYTHHHGPQADLRGQQGVSHLASSNQPNSVRMTPGPRQSWWPVTAFTADQNSHVMVLGGVPVAPCL
jgi:hypothetical protein